MQDYQINSQNSVTLEPGNYTIYNTSPFNTLEIGNDIILYPFSGMNYVSEIPIKLDSSNDVIATVHKNVSSLQPQTLKGKLFTLDAGHGGKDPGAINGNFHEADITLSIVMELANILAKQGAKIQLTRSDDSYIELSKRASLANDINSELFISIHCNSATSKSATGSEVLVYNNKSKAVELGKKILSNLAVFKLTNRGIKERPELTVLKKTKMPALLVEVGFISNDKEVEWMVTHINEIAWAISQGIIDIYGNHG